MIGFMPDFYPDELVYSLLARYYQRSGYLAYIHAAKDLYTVPTIRPDMYFINPLQEEVWQRLIAKSSPEGVILNHTMFPAYARFLPAKTRQQALRQMSRMEGKPYVMSSTAKSFASYSSILQFQLLYIKVHAASSTYTLSERSSYLIIIRVIEKPLITSAVIYCQ